MAADKQPEGDARSPLRYGGSIGGRIDGYTGRLIGSQAMRDRHYGMVDRLARLRANRLASSSGYIAPLVRGY